MWPGISGQGRVQTSSASSLPHAMRGTADLDCVGGCSGRGACTLEADCTLSDYRLSCLLLQAVRGLPCSASISALIASNLPCTHQRSDKTIYAAKSPIATSQQ